MFFYLFMQIPQKVELFPLLQHRTEKTSAVSVCCVTALQQWPHLLAGHRERSAPRAGRMAEFPWPVSASSSAVWIQMAWSSLEAWGHSVVWLAGPHSSPLCPLFWIFHAQVFLPLECERSACQRLSARESLDVRQGACGQSLLGTVMLPGLSELHLHAKITLTYSKWQSHTDPRTVYHKDSLKTEQPALHVQTNTHAHL